MFTLDSIFALSFEPLDAKVYNLKVNLERNWPQYEMRILPVNGKNVIAAFTKDTSNGDDPREASAFVAYWQGAEFNPLEP